MSLWESESLNPEMAEIIAQLWADEGVQEAYRRRAEFQLGDNALYYSSQVQRIAPLILCPPLMMRSTPVCARVAL